MNFRHRYLSSERGFALVLTLLILVLITAMVVEFAYGVYTSTSALHNWKEAQKLSFVSKSGVSLAVKTIREWWGRDELYKYLGQTIPFENVMEGFDGSVVIRAEDESGKFNLNSLVGENNRDNAVAIQIFKNLLENLKLNQDIADRVADWIDKDSEPRLRDSEQGAKNAFMDTVDELLLIRGVDAQTYTALSPYVTVYGPPIVVNININTAAKPVIMSLYNNDNDLAERIIKERELKPFNGKGEFEGRVGAKSSSNIIFNPSYFRITSVSEENGIRRVVESVVAVDGNSQAIPYLYWREM